MALNISACEVPEMRLPVVISGSRHRLDNVATFSLVRNGLRKTLSGLLLDRLAVSYWGKKEGMNAETLSISTKRWLFCQI